MAMYTCMPYISMSYIHTNHHVILVCWYIHINMGGVYIHALFLMATYFWIFVCMSVVCKICYGQCHSPIETPDASCFLPAHSSSSPCTGTQQDQSLMLIWPVDQIYRKRQERSDDMFKSSKNQQVKHLYLSVTLRVCRDSWHNIDVFVHVYIYFFITFAFWLKLRFKYVDKLTDSMHNDIHL